MSLISRAEYEKDVEKKSAEELSQFMKNDFSSIMKCMKKNLGSPRFECNLSKTYKNGGGKIAKKVHTELKASGWQEVSCSYAETKTKYPSLFNDSAYLYFSDWCKM